MELVSKFTNEIDNLINSSQNLLEEANPDLISIKTIRMREELISRISLLVDALPDIISKLDVTLSRAKAVHTKELSTVDLLISKLKNKEETPVDDSGSWTVVGRKPRAGAETVSKVIPQKAASGVDYTKPSQVKFTEALSLPAIKVPTFNYVKQDGELYYVETAEHFAFKIAGCLMHGNIGMIYTEEKNPEKIKDCKFARDCVKRNKCDYYHDPLKFAGSRDHRNFIASSWLYAPPDSQYKNRPRSRRFGSREYLDTDISNLQPEEISRFQDQTVHDLLCSLLLNRAYAPSK